MESTWNSPGRRGRAGKCSVSVRHRRDEAGLCPAFPGGAVEHQRGLGRHGLQYRLPRGGCAARSRGSGGTRPGAGAELHLLGPVVSLTGQSLRNRAITIEGAERSSSAQVLVGVPEAGILSLPLCPSTPRSLRGSASPLRSPEKGQQPYPVPSQASAGPEPCPRRHAASRRHVASGAAAEALPRHEFDVKHLDMKTYSHGYFRGLVGCRRRRCLGTPGISPPRTGYPRATRQQPRRHCGITGVAGRSRSLSPQLSPSCPETKRQRLGGRAGPPSRTGP